MDIKGYYWSFEHLKFTIDNEVKMLICVNHIGDISDDIIVYARTFYITIFQIGGAVTMEPRRFSPWVKCEIFSLCAICTKIFNIKS